MFFFAVPCQGLWQEEDEVKDESEDEEKNIKYKVLSRVAISKEPQEILERVSKEPQKRFKRASKEPQESLKRASRDSKEPVENMLQRKLKIKRNKSKRASRASQEFQNVATSPRRYVATWKNFKKIPNNENKLQNKLTIKQNKFERCSKEL